MRPDIGSPPDTRPVPTGKEADSRETRVNARDNDGPMTNFRSEQRDFAASLYLRWSEMGVGSGAGVTIKSYTGRVIASAEMRFSGASFHC